MMTVADAYPFRTLPAALRFAVALFAIGLVFVIDSAAGAVVDDGSHYLMLGVAVMATAWFAGTGPALAATVIGAVVGAVTSAEDNARATGTHLALFLVQGLLLTALIAELRRARRIAERTARDADEARRDSDAANRMKDEFLRTISHELRTPLNAVLGWVHLLRTGKLDAATSSRGLESIHRNVRLQARLTSDLLDVSKALTGKLRLDCKPVSLADAAAEATMAALPVAQAKGVLVKTSMPDLPVVVVGDAARLRQIAWHLLANAIKFTPRGGTVSLRLETTPEAATLIVADSGPGIDPAFLPRIFDRFTQEDGSPTRAVGGLGVGLSLVRDLAEMQGGEIRAENRPEGTGAVFVARFPLHRAESLSNAPQPPASSHDQGALPPLDGVRVLVMDRDRDGRDLLQTILQQRGVLVRTAESVADALAALEAWRPDVLVTDQASSDTGVYALFGKVHALEADRGGRIPAAALVSSPSADDPFRRMIDAVHCDLPKPIEPVALTAEIARLSGRERRRAQRLN